MSGRNALLKSMPETPSSMAQQAIANVLRFAGMDNYRAQRTGHTVANALTNFTPLGTADEIVAQSRDNRAAMAAGRVPATFSGNALMAVLAGVPGGKIAGKTARKVGNALAMDEASRMARAREMGFTTDAYHGSPVSFAEFNPALSDTARKTGTPQGAFVFTSDPENAATYAGRDNRLEWTEGYKEGGNVLPSKLALGKSLKVNAKGENWRDVEYRGEFYDINELAALAQAKGYDSLTVNNVVDSASSSARTPATTYFAFNPANIRSRFAAFDPAKRNSKNLMAGVAGAGVTGAAVSGGDKKRNGGA